MRAKHLSAQQDQDVKDAYLSGLGCKKILRKLNITFGQVNAALRRLKVPKRKENDQLYRKYKIKEDFFEEINTPEKAYFLGWMYSDGYNQETQGTASITLHKKDRYILEELARLIFIDDFRLLDRKTGPGLYIHSRKVSEDLKKQGCFQNKSILLKFPSNKIVPDDLFHHFIRGLFDGDGCFYLGKRLGCIKAYFSLTGSEDIVKNLSSYLIKLGITNAYRKCQGNCWVLSSAKFSSIQDFYNLIYKDSNMSLHRKKLKFEEYFKQKSQVSKK